MSTEFAGRVQGRLDRLGLAPDAAGRKARLPPRTVDDLLAGAEPPRGARLRALAEALECSVAYLVGLDPDAEPPAEAMREDQADFGLLPADEEALLTAYRTFDVPTRAALLRVVQLMAQPKAPS